MMYKKFRFNAIVHKNVTMVIQQLVLHLLLYNCRIYMVKFIIVKIWFVKYFPNRAKYNYIFNATIFL